MKRRISRRTALTMGIGLAAWNIGCSGANPFLLPGLLFGGRESQVPAEFPLNPPPKQKEAKVVILVSSKPGLHPDLAGVDRMLNAELIQMLDARLKKNEEAVLVMKMPWLDKYKADNPNWHSIHPYDIGKEAHADYLIDVEIDEMDIYKPGSRGQWLLGHATISISAYDINKPIKDPAMRKELTFDYPREGEIEAESRAHISTFRQKFVQRMASDTSILFSSSEADHKRRFD